MTFQEKLDILHKESLAIQRDFLLVIQEIRATALKGDALPEELIFRRETLYTGFNKILKSHRHLVNYINENSIYRTTEYSEGIELEFRF